MKENLLLDIVKVIEAVPEEQFNMKSWWRSKECGTVGCAIGHYCDQNKDIELTLIGSFVFSICLKSNTMIQGFSAIAEYLEIAYNEAIYLFSDVENYPLGSTKSQVISRILKFIEEKLPQKNSSVACDNSTEQKEELLLV